MFVRCLSCGAEIKLDPKSQKLVCEYCGSAFDVKDYKKKAEIAKEKSLLEAGKIDVKSYTCTQCGATLLTFDDTAVTFCSYCGSSMVIEPKLFKEEVPSYVIPFKLTKEDCEKIYKKKVNSFPFAPSYLKENLVISKFRGIYMPYGIYTAEHHGTQVNKGSKYSHHKGNYDYYDENTIKAEIDAIFEGISFDLASQFQDNFSQAIAPFNFKEALPFDVKYLSGFYADSYDVAKDLYNNDFEIIAKPVASKELSKEKGFRKYGCNKPMLDLKVTNVKTAYYPVYFLAIKSKNNIISYAVVNGQTGKCAIEMPIDFKKYIIFSLLLAIPIFLILNFVITLTPKKVVIVAIVMSIISLIISSIQTSNLNWNVQRLSDKGFVSKNPQVLKNSKKLAFNNGYSDIVLNKSTKYKTKKSKQLSGIAISIGTLFLNPVNDFFYYGAALVALVLVLLSFLDLVRQYNALVGRKFEQLGIRGGDERE